MSLFKISNKKLLPIKEKKINLEKDIQSLTEDNIEETLGYTFVSSEFQTDTFRFDTLAWDDENKSFVIVEYKKKRNFSVVDQGFAYLSVLLNRKADFILEYNSKFSNNQLRKEDIDWSQSRVVFVSPHFTSYQINSINFRNMPFDLYEIKLYENNTVAYNKIEASNPTESIDSITKGGEIEKVTREVKNYSVEDHFKEGWEESRELFELLDERLMDIDPNLKRDPVKSYIGYKIDNSVVFSVPSYKSKIKLQLYRVKPEDLIDPEQRSSYQKNSYKYYNKHVTEFEIQQEEDIDYAIMLAKQVYKKFVENN
jgi:predicted transport protein